MERLIIVGIGATSRHVLSFVARHRLYEVAGFAVNRVYIKERIFCNLPVYAIEDLDSIIDKSRDKLFVAIQWNRLNADRRRVYESLKTRGYQFANLISPYAIVYSDIQGDNCWVCDGAVIYNDVCIGNDSFIKEQAVVGGNTTVGNHCFIGIHAVVGGGSTIGDQVFAGMNSTIYDNTSIGNKCIVGAGVAVKRNMPDFSKLQLASEASEFKQYEAAEIESKLMYDRNVR